MFYRNILHAIGLHMHQPPGNLELLIDSNPGEAEQIIRCYERTARHAARFPDVACLHVGFSGVLLEQLCDPRIIDRYRHIVDIPAMLESYRRAENIELIGMGYYHPVFPLIPREDWKDQLQAGREIMQDTFGRLPKGFWPSEMAFSMEMIPALVEAGYEYVVVDGAHVRPDDGVDDGYRPYLACRDGVCITVIPRDPDISNAQGRGLDPAWLAREAVRRMQASARPRESRLLTTWSDGDNGNWFRQAREDSGFFGRFFAPYMEHARSGDFPLTPICLSRFLQGQPATARAWVQGGAWSAGSADGSDPGRWEGNESQQRAVQTLLRVSARYRALSRQAATAAVDVGDDLTEARRLILEGQTSCFLLWGDDWIPLLYERTDPAERLLDRVEKVCNSR